MVKIQIHFLAYPGTEKEVQGNYFGEAKREELENKIQTDVASASEKYSCNMPRALMDKGTLRNKPHQYVRRKQRQQNSHHNWLLSKQHCKLGSAKEEIGLKALLAICRV